MFRAPGSNARYYNTLESYVERNSWNGQSSPRTGKRIKLEMNPYNRTYYYRKFPRQYVKGLGWRSSNSYSWLSMEIPPGGSLSQAQKDNLLLDFYNEINGMATNLLDAVRTRYDTVNMITSNLMKMYRSMRHLKKGRWKKAARALGVSPKGSPRGRDVPARWLELQYGWLPLLGDIYTLGNQFFPEPRFRVKKSIYGEYTNSRNGTASGSVVAVREDRQRYSYVAYFTIEGTTVPTMQHLGVLNPLGVAWEAVPFSFVVDWFLPVGDWISALTSLSGVKMHDMCTVDKHEWNQVGFRHLTYNKVKYQLPFDHYQYSYKRTVGVRSIPLPSFKNPLSIAHFANGMSLLATVFGRKK